MQQENYKRDPFLITKLWNSAEYLLSTNEKKKREKNWEKKKKENTRTARIIFTTAHKLRFSYRSQAPCPSLFLFLSPPGTCHGDKIIFLPRRIRLPQVNFCILKLPGLAIWRGRYTATWFISSLTLYFTRWSLLFRANALSARPAARRGFYRQKSRRAFETTPRPHPFKVRAKLKNLEAIKRPKPMSGGVDSL